MPRTLLLADDSITIQKVVSITFAAEDFTVVTVDNGEDAFARAKELRPAIVLADVAMPRRNGYELSQAIKSDPELRGIPVLLLAGTFEPLDPAKAAASQANGHLVKPFDTQALIDKVAELLGAASAAPGPIPLTAPQASAATRPSAQGWPTGAPARPQPLSQPIAQPMPHPAAQPVGAPQRPVPLSQPQARPLTSPFGVPAAPATPRPMAPMPVAPGPAAAIPAAPRAPLPLTSPFPSAPSAVPMRTGAGAAPAAPQPPSPFSPPRAPAPLPAPSPFAAAVAPKPPAAAPFGRAPTGPAIPLPSPIAPTPARVPIPFPAASPPAPPPSAATNLWGGPPQAGPAQPFPLRPSAPAAFTPPSVPPAARIPALAPVPLPAPAARPARPAAQTLTWSEPAPLPMAPAPVAPESFTPEPFGIPGFDVPSEVSGMAEAAAAAVQASPADLSLDVPMEEEPPELLPEIDGFELGSSQDLDVSITGSASAFISGELSDFSQQGGLAPTEALDFDGSGEAEQPIELASPHEFLDSPAPEPFTPLAPMPVPASRAAASMPFPAAPARVPVPAATPAPPPADGEAALRLALSQASREVIERVVWEVVPQLAEVILREHVERMERERLQQ